LDEEPRPRPALPDGYPLAGLMRSVLGKGKPFRFEARGTSMHPSIRDGDRITVAPLAGREPRTGDVVAFADPGTDGVRVHRVVAIESGRYVLKGDYDLKDDKLGRDAILGLVVRLERGGRDLRLGPAFRAAAAARLSRTFWFTRLARLARRALLRWEGRA
jgi:signal peptidase I